MGKSWVKKRFAPPPPISIAKTTVSKLPQNLFCPPPPPSAWLNLFCLPPCFIGVKLHLPPPPPPVLYPLLPVISDHSLSPGRGGGMRSGRDGGSGPDLRGRLLLPRWAPWIPRPVAPPRRYHVSSEPTG